ncbi:low molecular weight phosphotyrosine protein phosphatase [Vibrio sp. D404a]|uniref:low molecular weight protein-tyrosine-phosphatase n=1 Tax=unclassified Vibrio TaxID=2614977 RepID=UPI002552C61C|nr:MULTISPECIES: low molecular weight protein-tyrosine-phosphatase [unclassified Vibrio]MDK9736648.1 low molecular weight phosphotyrosine protein phosphatase [Vibrio sp. D404a]MDK9796957.1 low molecular weight phosphotyrosine protein phosphatase [Vibrio sp. D449a]
MKKILVVCMGNICRSPTGEAILRAKAKSMGIDVEVDSAGTIGYHQGNPPDPRSKAAGEARGYSFAGITSRKVVSQDFEDFDLILAADNANLSDLESQCPVHLRHKLALFLSYGSSSYQEIPDPYYGGGDGFELVLDLIEESSEAVLKSL